MTNLQKKLYKPVVKNGHYIYRDESFLFDSPVEIHFTRMENFDNESSYKVLVIINEPHMSPNRVSIEDTIRESKRYDLILCSDRDILEACSNAKKMLYGGTWLNRGCFSHPDGLGEYDPSNSIFDNNIKKDFNVSFLASWHFTGRVFQQIIDRPGYILRKALWDMQEKIKIPINFYDSAKTFKNPINPLPTGEKEVLFGSMYHVCIENYNIDDYFSEKVLDPLLTMTIPIYWGCPTISNYFNKDGLIVVENVYDMINKINQLTPDYYFDRIEIIKENKNKAIEYATVDKRVWEKINEFKK